MSAEDGSPVKMPKKTELATGRVMDQLKGARHARLEDEVRELRAKCGKLEQDYKAMKKKYVCVCVCVCVWLRPKEQSLSACHSSHSHPLKRRGGWRCRYNQIRMAQAPTTRVVKANTVPTKIERPKSAAKSQVCCSVSLCVSLSACLSRCLARCLALSMSRSVAGLLCRWLSLSLSLCRCRFLSLARPRARSG
eukprot:COSAG03_NODE_3779_length_1832_cov_1.622620_2_plen_193_part_00